MGTDSKRPVYDVSSHGIITDALKALIGSDAAFCELGERGGCAWFPAESPVVESVRAGTYATGDILGHVDATCLYSFSVVKRTASKHKADSKDYLDKLAESLETADFPTLVGDRTITSITRDTNAYLQSVNDDGMEDWIINLTLRYRHEFDRL